MVYRNLNRKCWSVKDLSTGRVVSHRESVWVADATFKVSQAGRQRVLREGRKNVHAGVVGQLLYQGADWKRPSKRVRYDPYEVDSFVDLSGAPVKGAKCVLLADNGRVYVKESF